MRVLIVGCGYVGLRLGALLSRKGNEVFGLRRNPAAEGEMLAVGIQPLFADIGNHNELKKLPGGFEWVVNCVAAGGGADSYRQIYYEGTQHLLEWLASDPPRKFVYTSSTSVYAQNNGSLVTETSPTEPMVVTSQVLVETERLLMEAGTGYGGQAPARVIPAVILRVAGIYGPGRGHAFKQFIRGRARIEGDGSRHMNMIHRDDVAGCIEAALTRGQPGQVYNAVDNEPVSQLDFFKWLARRLGKELPPAELESEPRRRGVTNKRVSNFKLRAELGYSFHFPNFRTGYTAEIARLTECGQL